MTINILHLIDTDRVCGPGKTVIESARSLEKSKFRITIGAFSYGEKQNKYLEIVEKMGFDQVMIPALNRLDLTIITKLVKLIKEKNIKIVHTHGYKSNFFGMVASKLCSVKVLTTVHGWIQNNFRGRFYVRVDKFMLKYFDNIITVSNQIRNELIYLGVKKEKIITVHNAINLSNYRPEVTSNILRKEFGFSKNYFVVSTVGRLSREKGHKDFIKCAKILIEKNFEGIFFLIGDGPAMDELINYTKVLGINEKVIFTGYRNDMVDIFSSIDILINPSYTEGLPNVILEAMAMNKPVIATNVGGVSEIVKNEVTGLLIKPKKPLEIARSIEILKDNEVLRNRLIYCGRKRIEEQFCFKKRMKKIKDIYSNIIN